jgi:adenylate cyclase
MAEESFKRKLTAILSADAVGYSRLMAEDEAATVKTIASYREIMSSLIKQHRGRVVDSPGDNVLAEFSSVVDAAQCAVAVQNEIQTRNAELAENRRMEFRIGINLGDVIDEDDRIYGDGVNIAARLESLADPGGICVSKTAFDQIETKLPLGYEYLGEQSVKNIPKPVGAYRVLMKPDAAGKVIGENRFLGKFSRRAAMFAIIILVVVAGGLIGWNIYLQQSKKVEPASVDKMAYPLPERPSIAVLPFDNLTGDPEQEYFSDGFTEHIITSLSKVPYIFVIARNSTFVYKGKAVKINQIAEELGVRYVLEGSIQRSNDSLRITVQLIDAITGHHIWAENYDRKLKDIFVLQDEIAMKIMAGLQVNIAQQSLGRSSSIQTKNLKAYEKFLKGWELYFRRTEEDTLHARKIFKEAIALDPEYGAPYVMLGYTHLDDIIYWRTKDRAKSLQTADQFAQEAIELTGQNDFNLRLLSTIFMLRRQYDKAIIEIQKAIELSPNSAQAYFIYGTVLRFSGRNYEAIPIFKKAIRLNPYTPIEYLNMLAWAYFHTEQYEEAIPLWNKTIELNPDYLFAYQGLTGAYQMSGDEIKARESAAEILRIRPTYSMEMVKKFTIKDIERKKRVLEAYRKAGIPE